MSNHFLRRVGWSSLGAILLLAGCGRVAVQPAERAHVVEHAGRTVSFHIEERWIPTEYPSAQRGEALYARHCASCHGADGRPVAGRATVDFSTAEWFREAVPLQLAMMLHDGHSAAGEHSAFGTAADPLSLQQIYDTLAVARMLSTTPEELREINRTLFGTHCNVCHGNHGYSNGFLAPTMQPLPRNLTDFNSWGIHRTDQEIFDNIRGGVHWSAMPPWRGVLDDAQIWQLVTFIRAWQLHPAEEKADGEGAS